MQYAIHQFDGCVESRRELSSIMVVKIFHQFVLLSWHRVSRTSLTTFFFSILSIFLKIYWLF